MLAETVKNLQALIDADNNIELIEIWANCLFVRYKKGRCKFLSKQNITTEKEGIYFNLRDYKNEYKRLISKYHPDIRRNAASVCISQGINQWKSILYRCDQRTIDRGLFMVNVISDQPGLPFQVFISTTSTPQQQKTGPNNRYRTSTINVISEEEELELYIAAKEELKRQHNRNKKR